MLNVKTTNKFEKDFELMIRQGEDIEKLKIIMQMLAREESLDPRHRDHKLTGGYISHRECHVEPDWLLVYKVDIKEQTITFVRNGSHSDLFG
ncbi:MAG: type II toxin-antitoxin system YafQ family toxin [Nitrospirota bacterium]|nr:type II toxin-antitoxin system YafQ family toxin [Nitrospirota bacterium]